MDEVNRTRGAACKSRGIVRPGGAILGAWVGGGTILGAEVGEATVACACKGNMRPGSVIMEYSTVRGGAFAVERALVLGSKGPKGATCTSVCYLYIGSSRSELKA